MTEEYLAKVTFTRFLAEDQDMAQEKYPYESLQDALLHQFWDELQEACDNGMAGEFNVDAIILQPIKVVPLD